MAYERRWLWWIVSDEIEYYKKSATSGSSMLFDRERPMPTSALPNATDTKRKSSAKDALINQDLINVSDYRKNKATRKVIAYVPFKPD